MFWLLSIVVAALVRVSEGQIQNLGADLILTLGQTGSGKSNLPYSDVYWSNSSKNPKERRSLTTGALIDNLVEPDGLYKVMASSLMVQHMPLPGGAEKAAAAVEQWKNSIKETLMEGSFEEGSFCTGDDVVHKIAFEGPDVAIKFTHFADDITISIDDVLNAWGFEHPQFEFWKKDAREPVTAQAPFVALAYIIRNLKLRRGRGTVLDEWVAGQKGGEKVSENLLTQVLKSGVAIRSFSNVYFLSRKIRRGADGLTLDNMNDKKLFDGFIEGESKADKRVVLEAVGDRLGQGAVKDASQLGWIAAGCHEHCYGTCTESESNAPLFYSASTSARQWRCWECIDVCSPKSTQLAYAGGNFEELWNRNKSRSVKALSKFFNQYPDEESGMRLPNIGTEADPEGPFAKSMRGVVEGFARVAEKCFAENPARHTESENLCGLRQMSRVDFFDSTWRKATDEEIAAPEPVASMMRAKESNRIIVRVDPKFQAYQLGRLRRMMIEAAESDFENGRGDAKKRSNPERKIEIQVNHIDGVMSGGNGGVVTGDSTRSPGSRHSTAKALLITKCLSQLATGLDATRTIQTCLELCDAASVPDPDPLASSGRSNKMKGFLSFENKEIDSNEAGRE